MGDVMNQVQQAAFVEYDFTIRREAVLDESLDYALRALDTGLIPESGREAWMTYCKALDAEIFNSLRIGTDYDFDLYVGFCQKTCIANGLVDGRFHIVEIESFGSFYDCREEVKALYISKFGTEPQFVMVTPR